MEARITEIYDKIDSYAKYRNFPLLNRALPFIYGEMNSRITDDAEGNRMEQELAHAFEMCILLINLKIPLEEYEEDVLLTACLLHIYPENIDAADYEDVLRSYSDEVLEVVNLTMLQINASDEELHEQFNRIQNDRIALLLALADRGNIVQHLYRFSTWNSHKYIAESKACYYPMCIYGRESYPDLFEPISVLMEKLKSLIEVAEILLRRYEEREADLIGDILALKEENATIRGILARY